MFQLGTEHLLLLGFLVVLDGGGAQLVQQELALRSVVCQLRLVERVERLDAPLLRFGALLVLEQPPFRLLLPRQLPEQLLRRDDRLGEVVRHCVLPSVVLRLSLRCVFGRDVLVVAPLHQPHLYRRLACAVLVDLLRTCGREEIAKANGLARKG